MKEHIVKYYEEKRKTENLDTALNMTLKRFWFNLELITHLEAHISKVEKERK